MTTLAKGLHVGNIKVDRGNETGGQDRYRRDTNVFCGALLMAMTVWDNCHASCSRITLGCLPEYQIHDMGGSGLQTNK